MPLQLIGRTGILPVCYYHRCDRILVYSASTIMRSLTIPIVPLQSCDRILVQS
ncbi:MAG: hypothetical protein F6J94_02645 [Moorea sp. SIO1F2]|uniref:hypothetical protein n=1 Tax=Moorena sp. SIO1F2 TaxID=2607819 RepID=UPI0013B68B5B|nr:hypothetical protein [Moorena sp. SIO1F2]NET80912.1 hypothetical protein [Moorena sp. SIO1F2]